MNNDDLDFLQPETQDEFERPERGIVVDGSCAGNPGDGQYRIMDLETNEMLFESKFFLNVTNNQMELLATLHAISKYPDKIIYTDSQTAFAWVKNKTINSSSSNHQMTERLTKGLNHIKSLTFDLRMWKTRIWGENPADFNRKS
jgi:ribonuclease HI